MATFNVEVDNLNLVHNEFKTVVVNNVLNRSTQMEKSLKNINDYVEKQKENAATQETIDLIKGVGNVLKTSVGAMKMIVSGDPTQVMQGGLQIIGSVAAVVGGPFGAVAGGLCGVLGEILTALGPEKPSMITQIAELVHAEFVKFSDEQQKKTLRGLNERIETLRNTLNSRNVKSKFVDDSYARLFSDYEQFIGEVLYVFEKDFNPEFRYKIQEVELQQFLTAAVTYCNAETCFQALLAASVAKCSYVRSLYEADSDKYKEITDDIEFIKGLMDTHRASAKKNLEWLSDRKFIGASYAEPHTKSKIVKIHHLRINSDEYKCVEAFRQSLGLEMMPDYDEVTEAFFLSVFTGIKMKGEGYVIPSQKKDHHYIQIINETDVPIKVVSGLAGNNINCLKFTVNVEPHTEYHTPATETSWYFSAAGCMFVYLDGQNRPDDRPHSDNAKKIGFALSNPLIAAHKQHMLLAGSKDMYEAAYETWDQMTRERPPPIFWEAPGSPPTYYMAYCGFPERSSCHTYRFTIQTYDPIKDVEAGCVIL